MKKQDKFKQIVKVSYFLAGQEWTVDGFYNGLIVYCGDRWSCNMSLISKLQAASVDLFELFLLKGVYNRFLKLIESIGS